MSEVIYRPSAWGQEFHDLKHNEALGAGTAGVGKSWVLLMDPIYQVALEHQRCVNVEHPHPLRWGESKGWALYLRRTTKMLDLMVNRAKTVFPRIDPRVRFLDADKTFVFSSGFRYQFGHCHDPDDWQRYHGNEYTYIGFDELVQFLKMQYDQIRSRLRVGDPLLKDMLKVRAMSNPTQVREVGEDFSVDEDPYWVRKRFVDRCPEGRRTYYEVLRDMDGSPYKWSWVYLPGKLEDNPDEEFRKQYWRTLSSMPEHIRKALRDGDWYVVAGAFYAEAWEPRLHIIDPFPIPTDWGLSRSMDWGYRKPGVVHWWAHSPEGVLYCIREYKFRGKRAESVARRIKEIEIELGCWSDGRSQITGPADTQLWEERGEMAKSKASTFKSMGISWKRADKKSRKNNAERLLIRLRDHDHGTRDPGIVFFRTCRDIVRTLPAIPADKDDPEEPAKGGDDHAHDSVMYECAYASRHNGTVTGGDKRRSKDEEDEDEEEEKARAPKRGRLGYGT